MNVVDINRGSRRTMALHAIAAAADQPPHVANLGDDLERGLLLLDLCDELAIAMRNRTDLTGPLVDIAGACLAWIETREQGQAA